MGNSDQQPERSPGLKNSEAPSSSHEDFFMILRSYCSLFSTSHSDILLFLPKRLVIRQTCGCYLDMSTENFTPPIQNPGHVALDPKH